MKHNFILCGDFNYDNVDILFPKVMEHSKDYIKCATRKDKQSDYIIVSNKLNVVSKEIVENNLDHKLCIIEI